MKADPRTEQNRDHHGGSSLIAVLVVLLLSALLWPLPLVAVAGIVLAGAVLFVGAELAEQDHWGFGALLIAGALFLAGITFVHTWPARSAFFWVQGGSLFFVVPMICKHVKSRVVNRRFKRNGGM